jgi:hypothetical protein
VLPHAALSPDSQAVPLPDSAARHYLLSIAALAPTTAALVLIAVGRAGPDLPQCLPQQSQVVPAQTAAGHAGPHRRMQAARRML